MTAEEFAIFKHDAVHELMELNETCKQRFKIDSWPRWDYDLAECTLTFSEAGIPKVIAAIQIVGTTSRSEGTWMWGWANDSLPPVATESMSAVRTFGENEVITQLQTATLADDDYLGWEMTALAAKVIGAKGGYRCPTDGGFVYLIYLHIDFASADNKEVRYSIKCSHHTKGFATFICEHLERTPQQKWYSNPPDEEDEWPDAWCAACEALFQEEGGWNEANESRREIVAVCHHCYETLRSEEIPRLQ